MYVFDEPDKSSFERGDDVIGQMVADDSSDGRDAHACVQMRHESGSSICLPGSTISSRLLFRFWSKMKWEIKEIVEFPFQMDK